MYITHLAKDMGFEPINSLSIHPLVPYLFSDMSYKVNSDTLVKEVHGGKGLVGLTQHNMSLILKKGAEWDTETVDVFYAKATPEGWKCLKGISNLKTIDAVMGAYMKLCHKPIPKYLRPEEWAFKMGTLKQPGTEPPCWENIISTRHKGYWGERWEEFNEYYRLNEHYKLGTHCEWGASLRDVQKYAYAVQGSRSRCAAAPRSLV